jgi:hypothetical protein
MQAQGCMDAVMHAAVKAWVVSRLAAASAYHCLALAPEGVLEAGQLCVDCCKALRILQSLPFQVLTPAAGVEACGTSKA